MKEHLYQKCLQYPWLWGCGLWWCLQWWCWLWGCSTKTPTDPLDFPEEIAHNNSEIFMFSFPLFMSFFLLLLSVYFSFFLWLSVFSPSTCHPHYIPFYLFSHQHAATFPLGVSRQPGMTSPVTFCPIFLPPPPSFLLTLPSLHGFSSFQKVCMLARSSLLRGIDTSPMGSFLLNRS